MGLLISIVSIILAVGGVSVASLYSPRKQALLHHIKEMLKHLRSMASWDDRSELKLSQWMLVIVEPFDRTQEQTFPSNGFEKIQTKVFEKVIIYDSNFGNVLVAC